MWSTATRSSAASRSRTCRTSPGTSRNPSPRQCRSPSKAATFNADGTQNLAGVYNNPDHRAYPMSSYSYMIVPTTTAAPFNADKGATLGSFILYFVCAGQQKAEQLGYAPLPPNLVQNAFGAEQKIPGAPSHPR